MCQPNYTHTHTYKPHTHPPMHFLTLTLSPTPSHSHLHSLPRAHLPTHPLPHTHLVYNSFLITSSTGTNLHPAALWAASHSSRVSATIVSICSSSVGAKSDPHRWRLHVSTSVYVFVYCACAHECMCLFCKVWLTWTEGGCPCGSAVHVLLAHVWLVVGRMMVN